MVEQINKTDMAKDIKKAILSLADDCGPVVEDFGDDDPILELGILDSPGILELLCWYEKTYDIKLSTNEINVDSLGTVTKMVDFIFVKKKG